MAKSEIKVGLTIGKFAPLHKGHVAMLKFALSKVDKLFIIVYDVPDKTKVSLNTRANWIRNIFKDESVFVIEGYNAPNKHEDTQEVRELQENYIEEVVRPVKLTHFISSEQYGVHLSEHLGVENIVFDEKRGEINISSTMIRENAKKHIDMIPEHVLKELQVDFSDIILEKN